MRRLKQHPFPVSAYFKQSLVLTFALPATALRSLLPPPLTLDTYNDEVGFIAVALVQTRHLRPTGFPKWMGNDFFLAGYRIFTRYQNQKGKRLRGLYILESQADKQKMVLLGNLMTHYRYSKITVIQSVQDGIYSVHSPSEGFSIIAAETAAPVLPKNSVFPDWKTARRFAGPLPFTFTYLQDTEEVLIVQGLRQNWTPQPVTINHYQLPWLAKHGFGEAVLASAFVVKNIPYQWKKGVTEKWTP